MTFVVAYKQRSEVYIVSDAALTARCLVKDTPCTSFGEAQVISENRSVFEGTRKMFRFDRAVLAFAGDVEGSHQFIDGFGRLLATTPEPREAFELMVRSVSGSEPSQYAIVAGLASGDDVLLASYNLNGRAELAFHGDGLIQAGSAGIVEETIVTEALEATSTYGMESDARLASLVAIMQHLGIHDTLLEKKGIGGAIAGSIVTPKGAKWVGDLCYGFYTDVSTPAEYCLVLNRDDALFTAECCGQVRTVRVLIAEGKAEQGMSPADRDRVTREIEGRRIEYFVFLHVGRRVVIVVEMNGEPNHRLVLLRPGEVKHDFSHNLADTDFLIHKDLWKAMTTKSSSPNPMAGVFHFVPFEPHAA